MTHITRKDKYIIIILAVAFVLGFAVCGQYGSYVDQPIEANICAINVNEYLHVADLPSIEECIDIDHGTAPYYPVGLLLLKVGNTSTAAAIWNYYTFVLFFAGCLALFGIVYELFHDYRLSLITFGVYYLTPRIFAEGHYNNKDIILLTFGLLTTYFGMRYIGKQTLKDGLLFAVMAAIMTNVKIIGAWPFAVLGITYLIVHIAGKSLNRKKILEGFAVIIAYFATFVLITPAAWRGLFAYIEYCLTNATTFSRWTGTVRYAGKVCEVPVPADYLPMWMLCTTPLILIVLCLAGHIKAIAAIIRREKNASFYLAFLFMYLVPFVYALTNRDLVAYNGWRHFYFLYGPLVIFMGVGCEALAKLVKNRLMCSGLFGGILLYLLVLVISGHPYQYTYFNQLAEKPVENNWDMDYWCVSSYQALDQLYHSEKRNQEYALTVTGREAVLAEAISFPDKWNYEMEYVTPDSGLANYVVINRNYDTMQQEGYHLLFTIDAYGNRLYEVYERD